MLLLVQVMIYIFSIGSFLNVYTHNNLLFLPILLFNIMTITLPQQPLKSALRAVNARQSQTLEQVFML